MSPTSLLLLFAAAAPIQADLESDRADQLGDFIEGKHKGDAGMFIPWSELEAVR